MSSGSGGGGGPGTAENKWGFMSFLPFRVFSDPVSFASAPFDAGDEPLNGMAGNSGGNGAGASAGGSITGQAALSDTRMPGISRPPKGIIGWISDRSLLVVGGGTDPRHEQFAIREGPGGNLQLVREGWKRYLEED